MIERIARVLGSLASRVLSLHIFAVLALLASGWPAARAGEAASGEPARTVEIADGRFEGVFYGRALLMDLFGNFREAVWTFRKDGVVIRSAPEGSFEEFGRRKLTEEERKVSGRYEVRGSELSLTDETGKPLYTVALQLDGEGRLTRIKWGSVRFWPVAPGVEGRLVGTFSHGRVSTSGAASTHFALQYQFGADGSYSYGGEAASETREGYAAGSSSADRGTFVVKGSGLQLTDEKGKKTTLYLGTYDATPKARMLLIGSRIYEEESGAAAASTARSPEPAPAPAAPEPAPASPEPSSPAAAPASLAVCTHDLFSIRTPPGLRAAETEQGGQKIFVFSPEPEDPAAGFTALAMGIPIDDKTKKSDDPEMLAEVRKLVPALTGGELKETGPPTPVAVDGTRAMRFAFKGPAGGAEIRAVAVFALKDGRALFLLALASEAGLKKHEPEMGRILSAVRFAKPGAASVAGAPAADASPASAASPAAGPAVPARRLSAGGLEFELPRDWTTKEMEQDGEKTVILLPPGTVFDPETNDFLFAFTVAKSDLSSATSAEAIEKFRKQLEALSPGLEAEGKPEKLEAAGAPAILFRYRGGDPSAPALLQAYGVVKGGKEVGLVLLGPEARVKPHGAILRRAFESLKIAP